MRDQIFMKTGGQTKHTYRMDRTYALDHSTSLPAYGLLQAMILDGRLRNCVRWPLQLCSFNKKISTYLVFTNTSKNGFPFIKKKKFLYKCSAREALSNFFFFYFKQRKKSCRGDRSQCITLSMTTIHFFAFIVLFIKLSLLNILYIDRIIWSKVSI